MRLGLAAPGRPSIGCPVRRSSCGSAISDNLGDTRRGQAPAGFTNSRYLLILHLNQRACSPATALWNWLLVRSEVEGEEEKEVRRDDADTGDGSELLTGALAQVGHVWPVGAGEVGPGREVDEACQVVSY